jgi:hypothetical protein
MVKSELVKRSPLRILEKSLHGGLEPGGLGVIAARKGSGKTACLVHLATDKLFQGKHVIHVSFATRTDHIVSWYEDIFKEIARKRDLEDAMEVHDELIKNRVVMNFSQEGVDTEQVLRSIRAMIDEGQFAADLVIVDGYDFSVGDPEDLRKIKGFAAEAGVSVWFSATTPPEDTEKEGIPTVLDAYLEEVSVLISLKARDNNVKLSLVKDHDQYPQEDLHLELDPKTLLIAEE